MYTTCSSFAYRLHVIYQEFQGFDLIFVDGPWEMEPAQQLTQNLLALACVGNDVIDKNSDGKA